MAAIPTSTPQSTGKKLAIPMSTPQPTGKRIICCCDGTWMDQDSGYTKATWIPYNPNSVLQTPSNVTRISRGFKRRGRDGKPQIIYYHSGVGAGGSWLDSLTGGMFGIGVSENVRESYSFIATNYLPGDDIILIGFSRGAFTSRCVAGLIRDIGLLTREGMKSFFAIWKDTANRHNSHYIDLFPHIPFRDKPKGPGSSEEYRNKLVSEGFSRVNDTNGNPIRIEAVAVWDTVGSLGVPNITLFSKLGFPHPGSEFKFRDTELDPSVKHAFHALALDEKRNPFSPALWERSDSNHKSDLRQVWFPGSHSAVGGGYPDQGVADVSLAWMMDQLSSLGVTFKDGYIDLIHSETKDHYKSIIPKLPSCNVLRRSSKPKDKPWAKFEIYQKCNPVRPFGLGQIYESDTGVQKSAGAKIRTPGLYRRMDPDKGFPTKNYLSNTNERIHPIVRVRLTMGGLGADDKGPYKAPALSKNWVLRHKDIEVEDAIGKDASSLWGGLQSMVTSSAVVTPGGSKTAWSRYMKMDGAEEGPGAATTGGKGRWVWEYKGPAEKAPKDSIMIEENLGPYQQKLLALAECDEVMNCVMGGP